MTRTSLRTQLILVATAFVTLIWVFAIVIVAFNLRWFLDRIIDIELERDMRLANHLYQIIRPNLQSDSLDSLQRLHQDVGMLTALQGEWGFKTYYDDGRLLMGSAHLPEFDLPAQEGFSDIEVNGELWRVYSQKIEDDVYTVLVANKSGATSLILQNLSPDAVVPAADPAADDSRRYPRHTPGHTPDRRTGANRAPAITALP